MTSPNDSIHVNSPGYLGLTKREFFAALIFASMSGNLGFIGAAGSAYGEKGALPGMAKGAVEFADALIAALNQEAK